MQQHSPSPPDVRSDLEEEELSEADEDLEDAQHSLLNTGRRIDLEERGSTKSNAMISGRVRAYWLGAVLCIAGFLCKSSKILLEGFLGVLTTRSWLRLRYHRRRTHAQILPERFPIQR